LAAHPPLRGPLCLEVREDAEEAVLGLRGEFLEELANEGAVVAALA